MDERVRFVAHLLDGEKMAALCREFSISRKTGQIALRNCAGDDVRRRTNFGLRLRRLLYFAGWRKP